MSHTGLQALDLGGLCGLLAGVSGRSKPHNFGQIQWSKNILKDFFEYCNIIQKDSYIYITINTETQPTKGRFIMKKITKKSIELAVRNNDATALFAMFQGDRQKVHAAVSGLMIQKLAKRAYDLAYGKQHKFTYRPEKQIHSKQVRAILFAKEQVKDGSIKTNYAKVLIEGNNNIYWAHPSYGHSDYNKSRAFENTQANRMLATKINAYLNKHL